MASTLPKPDAVLDPMFDEPAVKISRTQTLLVVTFLILVQATGAVAGFWLPAIAPEIGADLGLSPALIGYQVLIQYVFGMLSSLMAGGFVLRLGPWRASQLALLLFVFAHALFQTGSVAMIGLGSVVLGCGYGLVTPAASHLLNKIVTPSNRNLVFSFRFTGVPLGGIATGLAAPPTALAFGWQQSVLVVIAVSVLLVLAMQPMRDRWDDDRSASAPLLKNPVADMKMVWSLVPLKWLAFYGLCMGAVQTTLTTYTVTMLVEDLSYTLVAAGVGLSMIQFASVFGRVAWGWLADRVGSGLKVAGLVALIAALGAGVTCLLTPAWPSGLVYALCFGLGFVGMSWNGVYASEIARLAPEGKVSGATGACMFITFSGVFLGPVLFVAMHAWSGVYTTTFGLTAMIALGGLFCVLRAAAGIRATRSTCR